MATATATAIATPAHNVRRILKSYGFVAGDFKVKTAKRTSGELAGTTYAQLTASDHAKLIRVARCLHSSGVWSIFRDGNPGYLEVSA